MSIWRDLYRIAFTLRYVDAGGVRTRSLRAGAGEPVVLLHGTSSHLEVFAGNVGAYAQAGYGAHAIDMLGHGYTDPAQRDCEIADYVRHVLAYLDAVGARQAHLVGESLGGWVAAWLAAEHPHRVRSLQLVCAGGTRAVPEIMQRIRTTTTDAVRSVDRTQTRARLADLFFDKSTVSEELVDVRYDIYHQPAFQRALPHLLCLQDPTVRQRNLLTAARLRAICARTLIFWGRHNPMGDISEAEALQAAIPEARLEVFDRCGHFPQLEHPMRFNRLSVEFLCPATSVHSGGHDG